MTKPPVAERPRLTLEDYILFFATHSGKGLTIDLLNQILFMHGFIKFHRSNKPVIVDALNSLDLLRPRRSTVRINAAARRAGLGGRALHGERQARHRGPRLARVPRRLRPPHPRRARPRAPRHHAPVLLRLPARLPDERARRLLAPVSSRGAGRGGEEEAADPAVQGGDGGQAEG
ncbi:hypothetical protein ACQ4PT_029936 [Festuca glaucescens]